jgi:hypothetical protein
MGSESWTLVVCARSGRLPWECDESACENGCPDRDVEVVEATERDVYRVLLQRLVDAADANAPIEDSEWLEALYAARNVLRDDQAKEPKRG